MYRVATSVQPKTGVKATIVKHVTCSICGYTPLGLAVPTEPIVPPRLSEVGLSSVPPASVA